MVASAKEVVVPDIGDFKDVDVIEVLVSAGERISAEDPLVTLESDKATMDVPSPYTGVIKEVKLQVGDKVSQGSMVALLELDDGEKAEPLPETVAESEHATKRPALTPAPETSPAYTTVEVDSVVETMATAEQPSPPPTLPPKLEGPGRAIPHASPSVRAFARELGVELLQQVGGTGPKGRILKQDVQAFVKRRLAQPGGAAAAAALAVPEMPEIDFSKFGEI
ncbi:MAG: biotin/lipoyl-containing protein, partial [Acidiferrobacterales bacterium]